MLNYIIVPVDIIDLYQNNKKNFCYVHKVDKNKIDYKE